MTTTAATATTTTMWIYIYTYNNKNKSDTLNGNICHVVVVVYSVYTVWQSVNTYKIPKHMDREWESERDQGTTRRTTCACLYCWCHLCAAVVDAHFFPTVLNVTMISPTDSTNSRRKNSISSNSSSSSDKRASTYSTRLMCDTLYWSATSKIYWGIRKKKKQPKKSKSVSVRERQTKWLINWESVKMSKILWMSRTCSCA